MPLPWQWLLWGGQDLCPNEVVCGLFSLLKRGGNVFKNRVLLRGGVALNAAGVEPAHLFSVALGKDRWFGP